MGTMEDIKNNTHQTKVLLKRFLNEDVRPRNWHDSKTQTATTEERYNVFKNLGKQGGRYLRVKVSKASTIKLALSGVGQEEKLDETLKANKVAKFRFKEPMLLTDFSITPTIASTVVTWWVSTVEIPIDLEDDMTHLDGDTFESVSDRAVLIAGEDGTNIRTLKVDSAGKMKLSEADNNQNFGLRVGGHLPMGQQLGEAFYADVDVTASGSGVSWTLAVKSIAELDALMTTNNGDYGYVAQGSYDEDASVNGVGITKFGCHYVGMGGNQTVVLNSGGSAAYIFYVTGRDVEICGMAINEGTATVEGILGLNALYLYVHHCRITGAMENGIHDSGVGGGSVFEHCFISGMTNDGIELSGIVTLDTIRRCQFNNISDNAIHLNGDTIDQNFVYRCDIIGTAGKTDYGITITLGDRNYIDWNSMGELGTWPVFNSGSNNYFGPNNSADSISGSYSRTVANGTTLITANVRDIDLWASGKYEFQWDLSTLVTAGEGGDVDGYIYSKVLTTYIRRDMDRMVINTDVIHPTCEKGFVGGDSQLQEGLQCSVAVTASRLVGWRLIKTS